MRYEQFEQTVKAVVPAKTFNRSNMELVKIDVKHRQHFIEALQLGISLDTLLSALKTEHDQGKALDELIKHKELYI